MAITSGIKNGSKTMIRCLQKDGNLWKVKRTLKMEYEVYASSPSEPAEQIALATGIPRLGSVFVDYAGIFICRRVDPTQGPRVNFAGKASCKWIVSVEMDNEIEAVNPVDLPPEVSWSAETVESVCHKDVITGDEVKTACGEPMALSMPVAVPVLSISRYYLAADFPPSTIYTHTNTVNSAPFWGAPAKHALLKDIKCGYTLVEMPDNGEKVRFAHVTYTIKFRFDPDTEEPWAVRLLHIGNKYKDPEHGILLATSTPGNSPIQVRLDEYGYKIPADEASHYLTFHIYKEADFSALHIDQNDLGF